MYCKLNVFQDHKLKIKTRGDLKSLEVSHLETWRLVSISLSSSLEPVKILLYKERTRAWFSFLSFIKPTVLCNSCTERLRESELEVVEQFLTDSAMDLSSFWKWGTGVTNKNNFRYLKWFYQLYNLVTDLI